MTPPWHVEHLQEKETIRRFLNRDRGMGAYALGDLHAPHWQHCAFFGARREAASEPEALVLRYTGFDPALLVLFGDPAGADAVLAAILDTRSVYFTADEPTYPVIARHYATPAPDHMWRMVLPPEANLPAVDARVRPLRGEQGRALLVDLFANVADDSNHFAPTQVDDGAFFGLFIDEQLVSCAGTHLICQRESVAAVGNIYTRPAYRGQGYATLCTIATSHHLRRQDIQTIALNVAQHNQAAVHIYRKLGYTCHAPFWEGLAHARVRQASG